MSKLKFFSLFLVIFALASCGENIANKTGTKVGETAVDFATGVGKGVDKKMQVNVEISQKMLDAGFSKTISKSGGIDHPDKNISIYLISKQSFNGTLLAKAISKENQEIGRSNVEVNFSKDVAKYVTFSFDNELDTNLVEKYIIDLAEEKQTSNETTTKGKGLTKIPEFGISVNFFDGYTIVKGNDGNVSVNFGPFANFANKKTTNTPWKWPGNVRLKIL